MVIGSCGRSNRCEAVSHCYVNVIPQTNVDEHIYMDFVLLYILLGKCQVRFSADSLIVFIFFF